VMVCVYGQRSFTILDALLVKMLTRCENQVPLRLHSLIQRWLSSETPFYPR